jgi:pimeloyl-ACP methyl ester carboxylesterase
VAIAVLIFYNADALQRLPAGDAMSVRFTHNGRTEIAYETFGSPAGTPLLLIMGLDFQMVWWPDGFCQALVERGFHVARFDNRDAGLSTHFSSPRKENPFKVLFRGVLQPAYTTDDMVDDGVAVMDTLGWDSAHVVGGSLGGALALATALRRPDRVRTVTTMMAAPFGTRAVLRYIRFGFFPKLAVRNKADTDEGAVEILVAIARALASPDAPFDEAWARWAAEISHARSPRDPSTTQRQMAAARASADLATRLAEISAPTLILHGADDPLVRASAAPALARLIPGARAAVYPAMGHDVPRHLWATIADDIAAHAGLTNARSTAG